MHLRSFPMLSCLGACIGAACAPAFATEGADLDTISVTASRVERTTREVPGAIAVVDQAEIEQGKMMNVQDAIRGTPGVLIGSKNGGYDVRLMIRGAGQKANYGVREVMVLRDGVPMTDPDSFSRFDYIDTQDIERIEITKGPGSLYGSGSAGGTLQILSKSVFDTESNRLKAGFGNFGAWQVHGRLAGEVSEGQAMALTVSHRNLDSDWRPWNAFSTTQVGVKHGLMLDDGATLESELSYAKADMQLPASMNPAEFAQFRASGEQPVNTADLWQHKGRYSNIWFFNSRLEKEAGAFTFRPRLYFSRWDHYHPVTGVINDNPGTDVFGLDLEFSHKHQLVGPSTLVAGVSGRMEDTDASYKYTYADVATLFSPFPPPGGTRIVTTLSDRMGQLLESSSATNRIYGLYAQETVNPTDRLSADLGFRFDRSSFDVDTTEYGAYNWGASRYDWNPAPVQRSLNKDFDLFSPRLGLSYALTDRLSAYAVAARADQVPSESELADNPNLDASTATNLEVGLKGRAQGWGFDLSLFHTRVDNEIVSTYELGQTTFSNAGQTTKNGLEFDGWIAFADHWRFGVGYAYSDFTFDSFVEAVRVGPAVINMDRAGNHMPYVPRNQYSVNLEYKHPSGFQARLQADTWGDYWMDNANSERYGGYDLLTGLMLAYETGPHTVRLNVDNLFDRRYAVEAKKSTSGAVTYAAGEPRSAMLTYVYEF